jgi:hypothetical protein
MARYNEILVGRINRGLHKYFGIKGDAPIPQLAGDVSVAHSLFSGAENRYLEGWHRFANVISPGAGGAGFFSVIRLRNPANSNVIAVIEKLIMTNVLAGAITFDLFVIQPSADPGNLGSTVAAFNIDPRVQQKSTCILSSSTNLVSPGGLIARINIVTNGQYDYVLEDDQELTLLPGQSYDISLETANNALSASFLWRERFLEESERT